MPVGAQHKVRFGPFEFDAQCGQLRKNGIGLKLQGQPIQVLDLLLERPQQLVTREELRERLWASDTFVDFDQSLNTAIKKLRQALGDEADTPRYIETLPKRGYRFIGEVDREEPELEPREPHLANEPEESHPPISGERQQRWKRVVAVTTATLLAIVAGVGVYSVFKHGPQPRIVGSHVLTKTGNLKNVYKKPIVDRGSVYFDEERPLGWFTLAVQAAGGDASVHSVADRTLWDISRDGSQWLSLALDPERRGIEIWTQSVPSGNPRLVVKEAGRALWSADGRSIFFRRDRTELYRANADGTDVERLATIPDFVYPHLSPDGSRIRFTVFGPMTLWEIGTDGRQLHQLLGGRKDVYGGSWSRDGKYYFFRGWDGERWSLWAVSEAHRWWWKKDRAAQPQQLTFGPMSIGTPAISNDGKQLYAAAMEPRGELSIYDLKSAQFVPYLGGISACYLDFSRDGQWIAYVSYPEGTLWRSRIDGSERMQLTSPPLAVMLPRWSPDGKLIAFTDLSNGDRRQISDDSPRRIYVVSADGGSPMLLLAGHVEDPTWSPDGNSITYAYRTTSPTLAGSEVRILSLQTQKSTTVPGSKDMWSPRWSPDGKHLVALLLSPPRKLMIYHFTSNSWEELASGADFGWQFWSPDSKFVYAVDDNSVVRIDISNHKREQIASVQGVRGTAYYMDKWDIGWWGFRPDGRLITTRNTGIEEIYAFDLEYK